MVVAGQTRAKQLLDAEKAMPRRRQQYMRLGRRWQRVCVNRHAKTMVQCSIFGRSFSEIHHTHYINRSNEVALKQRSGSEMPESTMMKRAGGFRYELQN